MVTMKATRVLVTVTDKQNVTTLRLLDFHQFHDGLAIGTLERVLAKTGFEALTPGERVEGFGKGSKVKERELR